MNVRKKSQLQEKSVAKEFGAKTVIASGSLWFADSDVRSDKFLIECKTTDKDFYSLKSSVWEKIEREADLDHMRIPLMVIDIRDRRFMVFNPESFDTRLNESYECSCDDMNAKSFRLTYSLLDEIEEDLEERIWGKFFMICGKKRHLLMFMRIEDFKEVYKGEL